MAWLVGLATDEEIEALQKRGYEVTEPEEAVRTGLVEVCEADCEDAGPLCPPAGREDSTHGDE